MANDLNHAMVIGRLVKQSELKYLSSGTAVITFSVAVNRNTKTNGEWVEKASFFEVKAFGKRYETLNQYLTQGAKVGVHGYLDQERWTSQEKGSQSKVVIIAENIQLLSGHANQENGSQGDRQPQKTYNPNDNLPSGDDDFEPDVPF